MRVEEIDTPALVVDLDSFEENLQRYQEYFDKHAIGLRPHIKTHKCVAMAHMQLRQGAIGITCQKVSEAEVMVAGGLDGDVLIPFNVIGRQKLERLMALANRARVTVSADSIYTVNGLSSAAVGLDVSLGVIVELDQGRTGVPTPELAVELGKKIDESPGLELRGIMIMPAPPNIRPFLQEVISEFDKVGLPYPIVSGGSTPCAFTAHEIPELTEFRAGEYPVGGVKHLSIGTHSVDQCAGRVLATVVSRPDEDRAVIDAGSKSLSAATAEFNGKTVMGYVVEYPDALLSGASEEHGQIDLKSCKNKPEIGEQVQIILAHPCPGFNEHDSIYALRDGRVEAVWPVDARGAIR